MGHMHVIPGHPHLQPVWQGAGQYSKVCFARVDAPANAVTPIDLFLDSCTVPTVGMIAIL